MLIVFLVTRTSEEETSINAFNPSSDPDPSPDGFDALLKMPLAVDHQGDQEAAVGSSTALSPPIYLVYNDASADVLLFYNTSSIISHSGTRQFFG